MKLKLFLTIIIIFISSSFVFAEEQDNHLKRFAFIVGANDGGKYRITLQYTTADAKSMANVLEDLGGVSPKDRVMLFNPDRDEFMKGLETIKAQITAAHKKHKRTEFFFYYSGHSDDKGLLLYGRHILYKTLREQIKTIPTDVRIFILDSCSSGAMTRSKGGKRAKPFLEDSSINLKGHAILTSSSADEIAQESDTIGGSFFTHYLVSGLRGAADITQDKRVTLDEAYQYAFVQTLDRTETTKSGAQHATYDIQLSGTGNLVLTELRNTTTRVYFPLEMKGIFYVRDDMGVLVAELNKDDNQPIELSLEPGYYRIIWERNEEYYLAEISLSYSGTLEISESQFKEVESESNIAKGKGKPEEQYTQVPINFGLFPPLDINKAFDEPIENVFSLGIFASYQDKLSGLGIGGFVSWQNKDMKGLHISTFANVTQRDAVGVSITGFVNITRRDLTGFQFGTIYNHNDRHVKGGQFGLVNYTGGNFSGAQMALVDIAVGNFTGAQLSLANITIDHVKGLQNSLINIALGNVTGAQLSLTNVTLGDFVGAQISLTNVNLGKSKGLQFSQLNLNFKELSGVQMGLGNINVGKEESYGFQAGLLNINVGPLKGCQLGIINYAEDVNVPIGILSIIRKGWVKGTFWTSDNSLLNIGIKHGSKYVYNIFALGFNPVLSIHTLSINYGIGTEFHPAEKWYIDLELLGSIAMDLDDAHKNAANVALRAYAGWQFHPHVALTFGPTLNFTTIFNNEMKTGDISFIPITKIGSHDDDDFYLSPGFMIGIEVQ